MKLLQTMPWPFHGSSQESSQILNVQQKNGGTFDTQAGGRCGKCCASAKTRALCWEATLRLLSNCMQLWLYTHQHEWPVAGALGARWKPLRTLRLALQSQRPHGQHRHVRSLATGFDFRGYGSPPKSHGLSSFRIISNCFESFPHIKVAIWVYQIFIPHHISKTLYGQCMGMYGSTYTVCQRFDDRLGPIDVSCC